MNQPSQPSPNKKPPYFNSKSMKEINNIKIKKLGKCFNIIDSPEIIGDLCDKAYIRSRQESRNKKENYMYMTPYQTNLRFKKRTSPGKTLLQSTIINNKDKKSLQTKNKFNPLKSSTFHFQNINQPKNYNNQVYQNHVNQSLAKKFNHLNDRTFYNKIKIQLQNFIQKIQQEKQIAISQVLILKQDLLSSFFSQIVEKIKTQCKQKGNLLHYIWNSVFDILDLVMKQFVKVKNHNQKQYLTDNLKNHNNYQSMLEKDKERIQNFKKQIQKANVFNNTLVFNLRCKRRQLKKAYQKIKICTNKLNQYKQNYLDLQKDHIDLLMDSRDISRQIAQYLIKRRQQILQDKKKTWKIKFNKKSNEKNTKKQIQQEPKEQGNKIQEQVKIALNKQYQKELENLPENQKIKKLTNFLFEDATDQFAFYQNNQDVDDDIIAAKMKTTFIDVQTDMTGFQIDKTDAQCQIDYIQKIFQGLSKNHADQTISPQQKAKKIFVDNQIQVKDKQINQNHLKFQLKIYNLSFLFQGKGHYNNNLTSLRKFNNFQDKQSNKSSKKIQIKRNSISVNNKQGSQISINIMSKKNLQSRKRISQNRMLDSELSNDSSNFEEQQKREISNRKSDKKKYRNEYQQENDDEDMIDGSQTYNFEQFSTKFALKKVLRKKKTLVGNLIDKQSRSQLDEQDQDQNEGNEIVPQPTNRVFGFIKTRKNSRFSQENFIKRASNSLNSKNSKIQSTRRDNKKTNFQITFDNDEKDTKRTSPKRQPFLSDSKKQKQIDLSPSSIKNRLISQKDFNKNPQKSNLMKILSKTTKNRKQTSSLHKQNPVKTLTVQTIKQQNPNIQIDQDMQQYLQNKKSQQQQNFFKNFFHSIQPLKQDLLSTIQKTKNHYKKLLPARQRNLCKIISNVYLQAYQSIQKKQNIYTLINPLFKFFQIGYGLLKKYDLYSRMISFLSHIYLHKDQCYIFYSFFFFTGISQENTLSDQITAQDVLLYLKLLRSLSFNFNLNNGITGLNVQNLYTSNIVLEKNTKQVLLEQKLNEALIEKVINKVHEKLFHLTGVDVRANSQSMNRSFYNNQNQFSKTSTNGFASTSNSLYQNRYNASNFSKTNSLWTSPPKDQPHHQQPQQIKLDVFKCCQLIMQQIITLKKLIQKSYLPLINHVYQQQKNVEDYHVEQSVIQFIIKCQFRTKYSQIKAYQVLKNIFKMNSLYNQYKEKYQEKNVKTDRDGNEIKTFRTLKTIKIIGQEQEDCGNMDKQQQNEKDDVQSIIQNHQSEKQQTLSLSQMCSFFLKTNISDFNKTYYNALNVFRLRQQISLNLCFTKLPQIRKIFQKYSMKIQLILLQQITNQMQDNNIINGTAKLQYTNLIPNLNTKAQQLQPYRLAPSNPLNKASPNFLNVPFQASSFQQQQQKRQSYLSNYSNNSCSPMTLKEIQNKKLLNLCFLRVVEHKANEVLDHMIGKDLSSLYNWLPISKIKL